MDARTVVNGHWIAEGGTHIEGCRPAGMIQVDGGWQCWSCHTPVFLPFHTGRIEKDALRPLNAAAPGCVCKVCRSEEKVDWDDARIIPIFGGRQVTVYRRSDGRWVTRGRRTKRQVWMRGPARWVRLS